MNKTYYFDMDGVLANFHKVPYERKNSFSYDFIVNLDPFMDTVKLVKSLLEAGNTIYISSFAACEKAKQAKFDWLKKYLPEIDEEHIIVIVGNGKKSQYMRTPDGILVDDKQRNVSEWRKARHEAILVEVRGQVKIA